MKKIKIGYGVELIKDKTLFPTRYGRTREKEFKSSSRGVVIDVKTVSTGSGYRYYKIKKYRIDFGNDNLFWAQFSDLRKCQNMRDNVNICDTCELRFKCFTGEK